MIQDVGAEWYRIDTIEVGPGDDRPPVIVAGGSPTFPVHALRPDVECSPGTFIY